VDGAGCRVSGEGGGWRVEGVGCKVQVAGCNLSGGRGEGGHVLNSKTTTLHRYEAVPKQACM
jgi:hypothetical protein